LAAAELTGISIVIPTYNRARLLADTLESVKALIVPEGVRIELLVINNRCTDETPQVIDRAALGSPFPVRPIVETQQGLCYARNRGLVEAQYEHVVYLDDDVEVAVDWLAGYLQGVVELDADCIVGRVTPKFEISVPDYLTERILDSINSSYSQKGENILLLPPESAHEVPGCNFGVRKSVALEVGGFDNSLDRAGKGLLAGGDTEFGLRLCGARRRVVYHPRCAIAHIITAEKLSRSYLKERWMGLGATQWIFETRAGHQPGLKRRIRLALRAVRLGLRSCRHRLAGNIPLSFQYELETRRLVSYLRGAV
jgi:glycosyltransferase involved in cell wall biosynthesis